MALPASIVARQTRPPDPRCSTRRRSYACYTALIPDLVPVAHLGRASGVMAAMSMLGSLVGFTLFGFVLDVMYAYWLYCAALVVAVIATCIAAPEKVRLPRAI